MSTDSEIELHHSGKEIIDRGSMDCSAPQKNLKKCSKVYLAAFSALLFPFAMGTTSAFTSTGTDNMKRRSSRIQPTEDDVTWIGSFLALGALVGGAIAGVVTEKFGRKGAMMIYAVPAVAGCLFMAYAQTVIYLIVGRFLFGAFAGAVCAVVPAYLAEISRPEIRGMLGSSFQVVVGLGGIIGTSYGFFMDWRWQAATYSYSVVLGLILISFMPESPRWLVSNGRYSEAVRALTFLYGSECDAKSECELLRKDSPSQGREKIRPAELLKRDVYKPLILSLGIIIFQQLCGANAIIFYAVDVFKQSSSPISPYEATVLFYSVMTISTVAGGYLLDRLGRKVLLVLSGLGMALTLSILAGFDYAMSLNSSLVTHYSWIPLTDIMFYIVIFSLGYGPIPWLMIAEISPDRVRGLIAGTASAFCWGFVFLVTKSVDFLNSRLGHYGTYGLYAFFCILSCIFTVLCLPETKGKSFEEIQQFFVKRKVKNTDNMESLNSLG